MTDSYKVSVNENYDFQLTPNDIEELDAASNSEGNTHLLVNQKSYQIEVLKSEFDEKQYSIKVNGSIYYVGIETALDQLIEKMGLSLGNDSFDDELLAPMPGIILEVNVSEGDVVEKGDHLCVLEAMKMENTLNAPRDGKIKALHIVKGDTVDKGKLLIEFETHD